MSKLAKSIEVQELTLKELQSDLEEFQNDLASRSSKGYVNARLADVEEMFKRAKKEHTSIVSSSADPLKEKYLVDEIYTRTKKTYFTFVGLLHDAIDKFNEQNQTLDLSRSKSSAAADIRLPRIQIKPFSGKFEEWCEFSSLFLNLIDQNVDLSDIQKLQYLKSILTGEAARLIQHLPIDGKMYSSAWEILSNRYENKRKLVNTQLRNLLEQDKLTHESAASIKALHDTSIECIHALANLGMAVDTWDSILIYLLYRKLPSQTQRDWDGTLGSSKALPKIKSFFAFIEGRFSSLENNIEANQHLPPTFSRRANAFHINSTAKQYLCRLCKGSHSIRLCKRFCNMDVNGRAETVGRNSICSNCLGYDHHVSKCNSTNRCFKCGLKHHTLLHVDQSHNNGPSTSNAMINTNFNQLSSKVLLATAIVKAQAFDGSYYQLRALVDPGSEATFITERATQLLKLKKNRLTANVTGLGQTLTGTSKYQTQFTMKSQINSTFSLRVRAFVFSQLTSLLPRQHLPEGKWNNISNLPLADPSYNTPRKIDLLLGADVYSSIISEGLIRSQEGSPVAQQTELGWILTGSTGLTPRSSTITVQNHHNSLEVQLRQFWEIEENLDERKLTSDEEQCQQHYQHTYKRRHDGRYEVRLPFKDGVHPTLDESKRAALARLFQIERKLQTNSNLKEAYIDCLNEYVKLRHMEEVTSDAQLVTGKHYFLPHHAVFKDSSTTTKLRVVFDASCKTTTGQSLNDHLLIGPRLQPDIIDLVAKWRKFNIALSGDISMMYRQIWIAPEDTKYQLILWRSTPKEPIKTYKLQTVTFGTASAPYLAVRTLHQLAADVAHTHPQVTRVLTEGFYVDDLIYGADNEDEAIRIHQDVLSTLKAAGFPLRKWANVKTHTKRSVLADIARIFDPLGWISPCVIKAKIVLQQLWCNESTWDSALPLDIEEDWLKLRKGFGVLQTCEIPRWIGYNSSALVQLHGFSDASEKAYAAVVYARVITNGSEHINIIASKTRVAPIKQICLPRLELCAAHLLAKLLHRISNAMQFNNTEMYAWSDSTICLAWIRGSPSTRTTFVANRVTEVQNLIGSNIWRHVASKDNPADIGSRGLAPEELLSNEMWWRGPRFLQGFNAQNQPAEKPIETNIEMKGLRKENHSVLLSKCASNVLTDVPHIISYCTAVNNEFFHTFSNIRRLIRTVALWRRYFHNLRADKKLPLNLHPLTAEELQAAQHQLVKLTQSELFPTEIKALGSKLPLPKGSTIRNLNPFLDSNNILRVGGRLSNSSLTFNQQHPIILKYSHHFTKLLVSDIHLSTLHGGQQLIMAEIRNTFWITNLKRIVKSTIHRCVRCHRYNAKMQSQLMGSLPAERVTISRPFTNTGVDYAGPVEVKLWKGRCNKVSKGYIAVFVCLCTKAIHIELVSDLSSAAFIAAYRRFIARRGICTNLFSDCGTNFKGASNEIKRDNKFISSEWSVEVAKGLATLQAKWHFNPPAAPHFGGLWEAGVKSIKYHLKRTIGAYKLTFEEMNTLLTQIEACLNSRPLCPMSHDPHDLAVLTPGHFLIGAPLRTAPDRNLMEKSVNRLDRWRYIQRLTQEFWKQWSTTYIHQLQHRPKWLQKQENIKVGDIVIVKEDNLPPSSWLLARVQELHPGPDGHTRVVTIRTATSTLRRPVTKLSPLPISDCAQVP